MGGPLNGTPRLQPGINPVPWDSLVGHQVGRPGVCTALAAAACHTLSVRGLVVVRGRQPSPSLGHQITGAAPKVNRQGR